MLEPPVEEVEESVLEPEDLETVSTAKSRVLTLVYNSEINFLPKCHSTEALKIPFIDNQKRLACASKLDGLVLATIQ